MAEGSERMRMRAQRSWLAIPRARRTGVCALCSLLGDLAARIDDLMTTLCLWSPTGGATLLNSFPEDPADVFDAAFLAAYRNRIWGA